MTGDDEFDAKVHKISELLDQAADIYSRQKNEDEEPDGGRFGARIALHAALELLEELGVNSSQLKPLNRLAQALLDLDQGTVADLLKPTKRIGRPPHPYEYELLKALVVAAVDLLMEGGKTEREATVHVARRLTDMGYTVSKRPDADQAVAVQNWRKNIDLNRVKGRRDNILHKLNQVAGDHQAKAEKLLSQLPGIVAVRKR